MSLLRQLGRIAREEDSEVGLVVRGSQCVASGGDSGTRGAL